MFSADQDDLATSIFGESVQLPFDGDGRIILPANIIEYADLGEQCAFVGMGRKFQIWNPSAFEARKSEARENVKSRGVTIPKTAGGA